MTACSMSAICCLVFSSSVSSDSNPRSDSEHNDDSEDDDSKDNSDDSDDSCKGNLTILRRILHLDLAKGNPK
jgi:hypothetical protein